jgi:hypothetical protein
MGVSATPCMQRSTKAIGCAARFLIMTRLARVIAVDVPHHVTQRGNARRFILDQTWTKPWVTGPNPGTQDVPHEPVSQDFLNSAWAVIIFFFLPRGSHIFGVAKAPHDGHCEDAQY